MKCAEHTNSLSKTASWVIVRKSNGAAIFETFEKRTAEAINLNVYDVVPILQYLQGLNRKD